MFCFKHPQILADKRCNKCSKWCCYLCSEVINNKDYCKECAKSVNLFSFSEKNEASSPLKKVPGSNMDFHVSASLAGQGMRVPWNSTKTAKKKVHCFIHPDREGEKKCSECGKMFCSKCLRVNDASTSICYKCWFDMPVSAEDIDFEDMEGRYNGKIRDFEPSKELIDLIEEDDKPPDASSGQIEGRKKRQKKNMEYEYEFEEDELEDREHMFRIKTGFRGKRTPKKLKRPDNRGENLNPDDKEYPSLQSSPVSSKEALFANLRLDKEELPSAEALPGPSSSEEPLFGNMNPDKEEEQSSVEALPGPPSSSESSLFANLNPDKEEEQSSIEALSDPLPSSEGSLFANLKPDREEAYPSSEEALFAGLNLEREEEVFPSEETASVKVEDHKELFQNDMVNINKAAGRKPVYDEAIDKEFESLLKAIESSPEEYMKEFSFSNTDDEGLQQSYLKEEDSSYEKFFEKIATNIYEKEQIPVSPYEKFLKKKSSLKKQDIKNENSGFENKSNIFSSGEKELVDLLKNQNVPPNKKEELITKLGQIKGEKITLYIAGFIEREDMDLAIKRKAVEALLIRKDKEALPFLLKGIKNEKDVELRKAIAMAYSKIRYGK